MRVLVFGSIEAGGTKFVCAVGDDELNIIERASFPTMNPEETMKAVIGFFGNIKEIWRVLVLVRLDQLIFTASLQPMGILLLHPN